MTPEEEAEAQAIRDRALARWQDTKAQQDTRRREALLAVTTPDIDGETTWPATPLSQ